MNQNNTHIIFAIGLFIGALVTYGFTQDRFGDYRSMPTQWGSNVPTKDEVRGGMMGGNNSMHAMHVSNEKDFILGMIPHHEEALRTAHAVLERGGTTPEIRTFAEAIIVAQTAEVTDMKTWYETWYETPYVANTAAYTPMMRSLDTLSGQTLDRAFLQDMIMHHMGAIMMAQSVAPFTEHSELKTLTQNIITTQSKEITVMQQLLTDIK